MHYNIEIMIGFGLGESEAGCAQGRMVGGGSDAQAGPKPDIPARARREDAGGPEG